MRHWLNQIHFSQLQYWVSVTFLLFALLLLMLFHNSSVFDLLKEFISLQTFETLSHTNLLESFIEQLFQKYLVNLFSKILNKELLSFHVNLANRIKFTTAVPVSKDIHMPSDLKEFHLRIIATQKAKEFLLNTFYLLILKF